MTRVEKLDGSPGGGKSYTLEQRLQSEKDSGLGLFDFWWLNFSTSARRDVEPTLDEMWPDRDSDVDGSDRAKTVHGLALSLMIRGGEIDRDDVSDVIIEQGNYDSDEFDPFKDFCEQHAIPYNSDAPNTRKILGQRNTDPATGNKLFAVNDYLRQTRKPVEAWQQAPVDVSIRAPTVKRLLNAWDEYKQKLDPRRYEHGDYVDAAIDCNLVPDVDVLLIDEFQDLAPVEYLLYKQWRDDGRIETIYIAGDENQSVYSFRGGKPRYFVETDVDATVTLKESYRCPSRIAKVGHSILAAHSQTDPRGFSGKDDGGTVTWETKDDSASIANAVVTDATLTDANPAAMLLTRTNRQMKTVARALRDQGVPFRLLGSKSGVWDRQMNQAYAFLSKYPDAESYPRRAIDEVFKLFPDSKHRLGKLSPSGGEYKASDVEQTLSDFASVTDMVGVFEFDWSTDWKRDVLRNALDAPNDIDPDAVKLGTVHTAKGLEAPNVYLFTNTTKKTRRKYRRNDEYAAEEHRVYYVGATRASERLTLVDGFFDGPIAPPLDAIKSHGVIA